MRAHVAEGLDEEEELRADRRQGLLVEEQLNRLSDDNLVVLIENKVGEDLNWIRLNGTFVGGLIGVGLYLLFIAVKRVL